MDGVVQLLPAHLHGGERDLGLLGGQDPLVGLPVPVGEHGAKALMPTDDVGPRARQGLPVDFPPKGERQRTVVSRGGSLELGQEPQPALGEGQGHRVGAFGGEQPRPRRPTREQVTGQRRGGGRGEQRPDRQFDTGDRTNATRQPGGQQRMSPQGEEVVVHPHPVDTEHLTEEPAEHFLLRRGRWASSAAPSDPDGCGQGRLVELSRRTEREAVEDDHVGGHQVVGNPLRGESSQFVGVHRAGHVGDQPRIRRPVPPHHHRRPKYTGQPRQQGLGLGGFHAETPDLDLVVGPPHEPQTASGEAASQVTGAVHPRSGRPGGIRHEPLTGQPRAPQIATGDAVARQVQLTGDAGRDSTQPVVEHVGAHVGDRRSDRYGPAAVGLTGGRAHRRLGGPVGVVDAPTPRPPGDQVGGGGLATHHQRHPRGDRVDGDGLHRGDGQLDVADPLGGEHLRQFLARDLVGVW